MSFFKKKSSSKRYQEGAIECSDFECVSFQDKPFTSKPSETPAPPVPPAPYRFERNEVRQSFSEGMDPARYAHPKSSIATVNNLGSADRKLSESHFFQPHDGMDHLAQLQRKRPGSARYSSSRAGQSANGHRHGSSSSLSSASSISSSSSFNNTHSNGFQHELMQTINQSLNQLSMMGEEESSSSLGAPPKPKRPSTDRVKTTMAFYANKPTFGRDAARAGIRQVMQHSLSFPHLLCAECVSLCRCVLPRIHKIRSCFCGTLSIPALITTYPPHITKPQPHCTVLFTAAHPELEVLLVYCQILPQHC